MTGDDQDWRCDAVLTEFCASIDRHEDPASMAGVLARITAIPAPISGPHRDALATTLLDACCRVVHMLHTRRHAAPCTQCTPDWTLIGQFVDPARDPREVMREWLGAFLPAFDRAHPPRAVDRAAALLRTAPAASWRLTALGKAAGCTSAALRRAFQDRFGLTPAGYLHLLRARAALELCRGPLKVEAIAYEVGYRSKKDLYATLARWIGLTPGAIRRLTDERRAVVAQRLDQAIQGEAPAPLRGDQRRRRRARNTSTASVPPTSAAAPTSATPA